ncbi:MAG: membrane dipeptidase [Parasphingorhabdus sp.]
MKFHFLGMAKRLGGRAIPMIVAATALSACTTTAENREQPATDTQQTESFSDQARVIHQQVLVLDAHADIVLPTTSRTYLGADGRSKTEPVKLRAGGMDAVILSVAVGPGPRTQAGRKAARAEANAKLLAATQMIEQDEDIVMATSAKALSQIVNQGKIAVLLGFQNARSLNGRVEAIDEFYAAGVRVFGLNHLGHNDFSDSSRPLYIAENQAYEPAEEHGGLSSLGIKAVQRINALGALLDVSQMSKAATLQAVKLSRAPVIASHSNVRKLSAVSRNLSDEEIDRIAQAGGVIHLAAFGAYLVDLSDPQMRADILQVRRDAGLPDAYSYPYELYWEIPDAQDRQAFLKAMRAIIGPGSLDQLLNHVDYIVKRVGIDHVGIGSDFNHGGGIAGFVDASQAFNLTAALLKRGYNRNQIEKIWSKNFMRVLSQAENMADKSE